MQEITSGRFQTIPPLRSGNNGPGVSLLRVPCSPWSGKKKKKKHFDRSLPPPPPSPRGLHRAPRPAATPRDLWAGSAHQFWGVAPSLRVPVSGQLNGKPPPFFGAQTHKKIVRLREAKIYPDSLGATKWEGRKLEPTPFASKQRNDSCSLIQAWICECWKPSEDRFQEATSLRRHWKMRFACWGNAS